MLIRAEERTDSVRHPLDIDWLLSEKNQRIGRVAASFLALNPTTNKYLQFATHPLKLVQNIQNLRKEGYSHTEALNIVFHTAATVGLLVQPKFTQQVLQIASLSKPVCSLGTHLYKKQLPEARGDLFQLASTSTFVAASYFYELEMSALTTTFQAICELYEAYKVYSKDRNEKDWVSWLEIISNCSLALGRIYLGKDKISDSYYRHFGRDFTQDDYKQYMLSVSSHEVTQEDVDAFLAENAPGSIVIDQSDLEERQLDAVRLTARGLVEAMHESWEFEYLDREEAENAIVENFGSDLINGECDAISIRSMINEMAGRYNFDDDDKYGNYDFDDDFWGDDWYFNFFGWDNDDTLPEISSTPTSDELAWGEKMEKLFSLNPLKKFQDVLGNAKKIFSEQLQSNLKPFFMTGDQLSDVKETDFAEYLRKNGFSNHIKNLYISGYFKKKIVQGITFEKCNFNGVRFRNSIIKNTAFIDCDLTSTKFKASNIAATFFENCNLVKSGFSKSTLTDVLFSASTFEDCEL